MFGANNAQKTPITQSLLSMTRARSREATDLLGKTLPCSVVERVSSKIVRVKFELQDKTTTFPPATMPVFGSEFIREPIQAGCRGMAISADAYLGQMSGLGSGVATLAQQPNLSCLMFMPFGSTSMPALDLSTLVLYGGSNGTLLKDAASGTSTISITSTSITLTAGGHTIVIDSTGVKIDGKIFLTHQHTGVQPGGSNTGGVA